MFFLGFFCLREYSSLLFTRGIIQHILSEFCGEHEKRFIALLPLNKQSLSFTGSDDGDDAKFAWYPFGGGHKCLPKIVEMFSSLLCYSLQASSREKSKKEKDDRWR